MPNHFSHLWFIFNNWARFGPAKKVKLLYLPIRDSTTMKFYASIILFHCSHKFIHLHCFKIQHLQCQNKIVAGNLNVRKKVLQKSLCFSCSMLRFTKYFISMIANLTLEKSRQIFLSNRRMQKKTVFQGMSNFLTYIIRFETLAYAKSLIMISF